jgi:hypothetical protein
MPLYTNIYRTYHILLLSDKFRKGQLESMNIYREFTVFENDMNCRKRKRLQSLEADDFQRSRFT